MTAIAQDISRLHSTYGSFIEIIQPTTPQTVTRAQREIVIRAFSTALSEVSPKAEHPHLYASLLKMQKRWGLICHQLLTEPDSLSQDNKKRIDKIGVQLSKLQATFFTGELPKQTLVEKNAAEEISDLLNDEHANSHLKELLSKDATRLLQSSPKALKQAKIMLTRILSGQYGLRLKHILYDGLKNPLNLDVYFIRLLFVDMLLRNVNPRKKCEWFSECPKREVRVITENLLDVKENLVTRAALSEREAHAVLAAKQTCLARDVEALYQTISKRFDYRRARHEHVLEHLCPYYQPTNAQLFVLGACFVDKNVTRAFRLVSHIRSPRSDREKYVSKVFQLIVNEHPLRALGMLQQIKDKDSELYVLGLRIFTEHHISQGTAKDLEQALGYLPDIERDNCFQKVASRLISRICEGILEEPLRNKLGTIIASLTSAEAILDCFEAFFLAQLQTYSSDPLKGREVCLNFLKAYCSSDLYAFGFSSFVFARFCDAKANMSPSLLECYKQLAPQEVRSSLLERIVLYIFNTFKDTERGAMLEALCTQLKEMPELDILYKTWAVQLNPHNRAEALNIARLIANKELKLMTTRLLALPAPASETNPALLVFLFSLLNLNSSRTNL